MQIGAQLYTLREQMNADPAATLARVAEIGYRHVQVSGFSYDAGELKALCDGLGLSIQLTHTPPERILGDTAAVIAEHKTMNCPYVGIGGMPPAYRDGEGARRFIADFTPAMRAFADAGLKFQYHNHSFEFERFGGETIFDILLRESDPALLGFTLDTYWVQHGGLDVPALIRRMAGRIDVCHVKDMAIVNGGMQVYAPVGHGNMNWPAILAAFAEIGTQFAFVEQDECYDEDPLDELAKSFSSLRCALSQYHK
ncbi:MAG: sugar phosphate isomerase/epimerase [Oscillospiraceae bacterium]|nr:sugar phosphate isomerase/epimerase [Oscillospiraceae bacterium]